jgi:hypothetical protein
MRRCLKWTRGEDVQPGQFESEQLSEWKRPQPAKPAHHRVLTEVLELPTAWRSPDGLALERARPVGPPPAGSGRPGAALPPQVSVTIQFAVGSGRPDARSGLRGRPQPEPRSRRSNPPAWACVRTPTGVGGRSACGRPAEAGSGSGQTESARGVYTFRLRSRFTRSRDVSEPAGECPAVSPGAPAGTGAVRGRDPLRPEGGFDTTGSGWALQSGSSRGTHWPRIHRKFRVIIYRDGISYTQRNPLSKLT